MLAFNFVIDWLYWVAILFYYQTRSLHKLKTSECLAHLLSHTIRLIFYCIFIITTYVYSTVSCSIYFCDSSCADHSCIFSLLRPNNNWEEVIIQRRAAKKNNRQTTGTQTNFEWATKCEETWKTLNTLMN